MSTRIEGPRSRRVRFSTGRAAELRAVPSFRVMLRERLLDQHDLDDIQSVIADSLDASRLGPLVEDAILRHIFLSPPMDDAGLSSLDDSEVREAVAFAFRAYLEANAQPAIVDEELAEDEDLEGEPDPVIDPDEAQRMAERAVSDLAKLEPEPEA